MTDQPHPYQDPALPIADRVTDLLARMTLDEKLAQMTIFGFPGEQPRLEVEGPLDVDLLRQNWPHGVGGIGRVGLYRGSRETAVAANTIQHYAMHETRLGIPILIIDEALHGLMGWHATSFPQAIGLAATWDPALVEQAFTAAAAEMRARGSHWALTPVLDLARDPRWGRTEETYGEDPHLAAQMGAAAIFGLQGRAPDHPADRVLATAKHFAVHGQPEGGTNCAPANYAEREIREVFLRPFQTAVQIARAATIMASYNEINGIPVHKNKWLLQDVLRGEWGFDGLIISDGGGIRDLERLHHVAADRADAARQALESGIEYELDDCFALLKEQVAAGLVDEALIDTAVARILGLKFALGLFENSLVEPEQAAATVHSPAHRALALEAARKTITLLQNEPLPGGQPLLPLDTAALKRVAVIGPNAARVHQGGYSVQAEDGVSVLDSIRHYLDGQAEVVYAEGCRITQDGGGWPAWWRDAVVPSDPAEDAARIQEATAVAQSADVAILVLGENEGVCREGWSRDHLGDRSSLDLPGAQEALLQAVAATGVPVVLVLINGRPLSIQWAADHIPAILECWYVGEAGGTAVAETIFGANNPGGKLPITFPRSVGQIPAFYNHKPSARRGYLFHDNTPLFPFGHGLSYTTFAYSDLEIIPPAIPPDGAVTISVTVTNTGQRAGDEVVQLYLRDCLSSVTRPVRELKGFQRLTLQPGESRRVAFTLTPTDLALLDEAMRLVVEPGEFAVMVGGRSVGDGLVNGRFTVT
ncbi:MAG: glycoside hydrolase family 3 C-terminal domain-containing protein [Ardenticatenaceae bacterium]|nr:glycoside hydrolase family 3 C-terminal domain-containing protein [Ardenticatenaceae bacterium]MCB8987266.1 glycoside hydrolase family 3 C-terminal domain-containing protein [Ardenticatenaceae bacterium]